MHWLFRRKQFPRINKTIYGSANNYVLMNIFEQRHKKLIKTTFGRRCIFIILYMKRNSYIPTIKA